jgi:hypothetical protein
MTSRGRGERFDVAWLSHGIARPTANLLAWFETEKLHEQPLVFIGHTDWGFDELRMQPWSTRATRFEEVQALLGELRNFKRKRAQPA